MCNSTMERDVTEGEFTILIDQPLLETGTVMAAESRLKKTQYVVRNSVQCSKVDRVQVPGEDVMQILIRFSTQRGQVVSAQY